MPQVLRSEFNAPIARDRDRIATVQPSPECEVRSRKTAFDDTRRLSGTQRRSDHVDGGQVDVMMLAEQRAPGSCRENNGVRCEPAALRPDAGNTPRTRVETSHRAVLVYLRAENLRATCNRGRG